VNKTCTVVAYFFAKPERRTELEEILRGFVEKTRQEPGCINYDLHQSDDDPNVFLFYENWQSRKHWDEHNQQPYLASFREKRMDYLTKDIEVECYTMMSEWMGR
jgi:quinol monooxygenase YgiN